jgi:hypothetical protein
MYYESKCLFNIKYSIIKFYDIKVIPANGIVCPDDATVPMPTLPTTTISTTPQPSVSSITSQSIKINKQKQIKKTF